MTRILSGPLSVRAVVVASVISVSFAAVVLLADCAMATIPYGSAGGLYPGFGPGLSLPPGVGGKEYSHDLDYEVLAAGPPDTAADPQQIIAWDGSGGVANIQDYSFTRTYTPDDQVDAIANRGDFAYEELKADIAHLVFSMDDTFVGYPAGLGGAPAPGVFPSGGPNPLPGLGGAAIGGAGELSYELGTAFGAGISTVGTWAKQAEINGMPLPDDVDGVEVWGPEYPGSDGDKYSLSLDIFSGTSVWNGSGSPYIPHSAVAGAVMALLGTDVEPDNINIDALMVHDVFGSPERFDDSPAGPGDEILFSISQIPDPADPSGYYATGSELFLLNASAPPAFLFHGGHFWDKGHALTAFNIGGPNNPAVLDVNAIEAIGEFAIPEPTSAILILLGAMLGMGYRGRAG